jgi:hypothetical protein
MKLMQIAIRKTRVRQATRQLLVLAAIVCTMTAGTEVTAQRRRLATPPGPPFVLDNTTTILFSADEAPALASAVDDLVSDMEKVFGQKPRIVRRPEDAGPATIVIGQRSAVAAALRSAAAADPESFSIAVKRTGWKVGPPRVMVLSGADMRGTIYSI